nr:MAG TPA: hypothetical protein [Caudoviricetes sp.]
MRTQRISHCKRQIGNARAHNRQRGCQLCVTLRKFYFFYYLAY